MNKVSSKVIAIAVFLILLITNSGNAQYASWIKLSKDAPKNIEARNYPVPTKEQVGIPPYPGGFLSSVSAPKTDTLKHEKEILPFVILVSSDPPSKVIAYYKNILTPAKGWNFSSEYSRFALGDPLASLTGFIPAVAIREENGENFDLVYADERVKKSLKSRIEITYQPSNKKK